MFYNLIAKWGAPALLVAVALTQIYRHHTAYISPWKRGGFGMFASIDSHAERQYTLEVTDRSGKVYEVLLNRSRIRARREWGDAARRNRLEWFLNSETLAELRSELLPWKLAKFAAAIAKEGHLVELPNSFLEYAQNFVLFSKEGGPGIDLSGGVIPVSSYFVLVTPEQAQKIKTKTVHKPDIVKVSFRLWRYDFDSRAARLRWKPIASEITFNTDAASG